MGVATAPEIRYDESIHDEVSYGILNSLMMSGIAGSNMVSPYIVISSVEPKIPSVIQAVLDIFSWEGGGSVKVLLPFWEYMIADS